MTDNFRHKSGLPKAYDRTPLRPGFSGVVFTEDAIIQGAELNEMQSLLKNRQMRTSDVLMRDGDRISGGEIIVDAASGTVTLTKGKVYVQGDVRSITAATLRAVPMAGNVQVGVRMATSVVTAQDDPALRGLEPGTDAEGEDGAAREVETTSWGFEGDGQVGHLYAVYLLQNGVVIDQTAPPETTGVNAQIAQYDSAAHGNYVVSGCQVTALGVAAGQNIFSIGAGEANILGFKRSRSHDLRYARNLDPETALVSSEPQTFVDGGTGTAVIKVNHAPIASVLTVVVEKLVTETVTHGAITGALDALAHSSVTQIVSVSQGATTYAASKDYLRFGDKLDWTPGGAEPAPASTYSVTYRYLSPVSAGSGGYSNSAGAITVSGGITGGQVFLTYTWSLPRIDLLCLDHSGAPAYVKGIAAPQSPVPPLPPSQLLPLAIITNTWDGTPAVEQAGIRAVVFVEQKRFNDLVLNLQDLLALERLRSDIDTREPVAKRGVFVDPFVDDTYRDPGAVQSAAVFDGQMVLAIDATPYRMAMNGPVMLDYTEEVIVDQPLSSLCLPINPYQSFSPVPGEMALDPSDDFWTDFQTLYTSPVTRSVTGNNNATTTSDEFVSHVKSALEYLRQIPLRFSLRHFAANERLIHLSFDGVNVLPQAALTADATGMITGTFTIPPLVKAGTKIVHAEGSAGSIAEARFTGQGTMETLYRRLTTTITRQPPVTPPQTQAALGRSGNNNMGGFPDPVGQTFSLTEGRFVTGINLKFCAAGDRNRSVIVELKTVENGQPTATTLAQSVVDMKAIVLGAWTTCRLKAPIWLNANTSYAWVIKTDDPQHSVCVARLGDADIATARRIAGQPYTVGVFLSSSNAETWTPHQDMDLTFQVLGAVFAPVMKSFNFGSFSVAQMSDVIIRALTETPTAEGRIYFELERQNGQVIKLANFQPYQFSEYVNEPVKLHAVLEGTRNVSPVFYSGVTLVAGSIRGSGTYVSRAFAMKTGLSAVRVTNYIKALLPSGATLTAEIDNGAGTWVPLPLVSQDVLDKGWLEKKHEVTGHTAAQGRVRLTLNGGPAARPKLSDLRCLVV